MYCSLKSESALFYRELNVECSDKALCTKRQHHKNPGAQNTSWYAQPGSVYANSLSLFTATRLQAVPSPPEKPKCPVVSRYRT